MEMQQGLFLHRINVLDDRATIDHRVQGAILILTDVADPLFAICNTTTVRAQAAPHAHLRQFFVEHCLSHVKPLHACGNHVQHHVFA